MNLSPFQKLSIEEAVQYADVCDKSTEWMFQYACDKANCDIDDVIEYLYSVQHEVTT